MRKILNCTDNKITVNGDGIEYTICRSINIIQDIKIEPKIMADIEAKLDQLLIIDTRPEEIVPKFKRNLRDGKLSLKEMGGYGWLNTWCYTPSDAPYGEGHDSIKSLEKALFGFEIEEKIWGEKDGKRVNPGVNYIFDLASKKIHENLGPCPENGCTR